MKIIDQIGKELIFEKPPTKIISVVPSQTELLAYLNLDKETIGITKFCVHPNSWFKNKTRVGGTKTLNLDLIKKLKPDLIIANKEENVKEQIENLSKNFPVYTSDIKIFNDALNMIRDVGKMTAKQTLAADLIKNLKSKKLDFDNNNYKEKSAVYLIWNEPKMLAGNDTFINEMLKIAKFKNAFGDRSRYPTVTNEDLQKANPAYVLLSSEPFPFKEKHIKYYQNLLPKAKVILVDGTYFSWYGNRLLDSFDYFSKKF